MRISDWSSDVCSSDLAAALRDGSRERRLRFDARRPDQWHATLCFIGYDAGHLVTPALLDAFASAAARIPPHGFSIERLTYWPQSGAVVALPFDCPPLQALATRPAMRSAAAGFPRCRSPRSRT